MTPRGGDESREIDSSPGCPSENELLDLVAGRLAGPRGADIRAHLFACSACQELVGDLAAPEGMTRAPPCLARGDAVGRYLVLGVLGAGAMGVVYEAFDPELERTIALKLVRTDGELREAAGERVEMLRARLLREAQAMARLAHPNVIAVHDVGSFGDQVFVAMERVDGGTLGAWLAAAPRAAEEILALFVQAGRGLAAAHAAGIIHRDFKPDNVLVGSDGRARVTDFGLARAEGNEGGDGVEDHREAAANAILTRTGALVGTPAYMAPEQMAGQKPDARADIYAFSVALFEALSGVRPFSASTIGELRLAIERGAVSEAARKLPSRVRAAIRKGLAARREDRWPTMDAMLAALAPKPRAGMVLLAGAAMVIAIAVGVAALTGSRAPCAGAARAWGDAWDEAAKERARAAFLRSGVPYAGQAIEAIDRALRARREAWIEMRTAACEATRVRGEQSEAVLDRRVACFDDRRRETAALVRLFAEADAPLVERAQAAVKGLGSLDECANARALGAAPPLTAEERARADRAAAEVAEARALRVAGKYQRGLDVAVSAAGTLGSIGDIRLHASTLFTKGRLLEELMRYAEAEAVYHEVVRVALAAHDDAAAADAWLRLGGIAGYRREQAAEARLWLSYAEVSITNLGGDRARLAELYEKRSLVGWSIEAKLEEANLDYARSLALARGLPIEQASRFREQHGPIQFDMGRYDIAERIFQADVARIERELGKDHPEMLEAAENLAEVWAMIGRAREAIPIYRELLTRFPDRAAGYTNHRLADALRRAGDIEGALLEDRRALAAQAGEPADALSQAPALTGEGLDLLLLGRAAEALAPLERAAMIRQKARLATARAETDYALARALWAAGGDRDRARALAASARAAYAAAAAAHGSRWYAAEAATIGQWEQEHSR